MDIDLKSSKRWLDPSDVVDFVQEMVDKIEQLELENDKLNEQITDLESQIEEHVEECKQLKDRIKELEEE